jgi:Zn-dependent peptidase ImmA (M78 family)/DNA-binding XRE family transcriptional regulator
MTTMTMTVAQARLTCPSNVFRTAVLTPSRFVVARSRRGYTKKQLAAEAGVSVRSITAYEAGETIPEDETLQRIASTLEFPVEFFYGDELVEISDDVASFRSLARMTASQRHAAQAAGSLALALHDWIAQRFRLPDSDVPRIQPGVDPIPNLLHLMEVKGVRVFSLAQECREVDAFSLWRQQPFVFLNTQKSAEHSRFDAAHELGHLVMHWHHELPQGKQVEREANDFASAFLMPAAGVITTLPRQLTLPHLIRLKRPWKVSVAALAYRLHALTVLSDWRYRQLCIQISKEGFRTHEPQPVPRETSQVLNKVFKALRHEGVGIAQLARDLRMYPRDLEELVFNLAMVPIEGVGHAIPSNVERLPVERALRLV